MRVGVIGCGAVGGYYGGRLQSAGHEVAFLVREERVAAYREAGLTVESPKGDLNLTPAFEHDASAIGPVDLVLVAVKSHDTERAAEAAGPMVGPETLVLTIQNGVENPGRLARRFGDQRVLAGSCTLEVDAPGPGRIDHTSPFDNVIFGPLAEGVDDAAVARAFEEAGVEVERLPDGRSATWAKAAFLSPFSAFTTLLRVPIGAIRAQPLARDLMLRMSREVIVLAKKLKVPMTEEQEARAQIGFTNVPDGMTSSMYRDLVKGRQLEVEGLLGALWRCSEETGQRTPITEMCYGALKVIEHGSGR